MTAPYDPFFDVESPLVAKPKPPAPEAHDRIFDQLRTSGPGPTPADATAVRPPTPRASAKQVALQFAHGLGESGLQAVELLGHAVDAMNPSAAMGLQPGAYSLIHKFLEPTRQQMSEYYGEPKTDEELASNLLGTLVGGTATGAVGEGVVRPVQSILSEVRAAQAPFRLVKWVNPVTPGFEPTSMGGYFEMGPTGPSVHNYKIIDNKTGGAIGSLHGDVYNGEFRVDMISAPGLGVGRFSSGTNKLGLRNTRELLRQLQEFHPEVREIGGERVSGARSEARGSLLNKGLTYEEFPPALNAWTRVPVPARPEAFPTFYRAGQAAKAGIEQLQSDIGRVLRSERGSFKWGDITPQPGPAPTPPPQAISGKDFDEILNRAYFGRPTGPLVNPRNVIDPGIPLEAGNPEDVIATNRQLLSEDVALGRVRRRALKALGDTRTERETRIANNMLRDRIMANEDLLRPTSRTFSEAVKPASVFDFLRGLSRQ